MPLILLSQAYTPSIVSFGSEYIAALNSTPFNGVCILLSACQGSALTTWNNIENAVTLWNSESNKDVWPYVCFNRLVEKEDGGYFEAIAGVDLWDEAGVLSDLLELLKQAVTLARDTGSPGIAFDLEPYHNYGAYQTAWISWKSGKTYTETRNRLYKLGEELGDEIHKIYPTAYILCFFTGLSWIPRSLSTRTVTYMIIGILNRAVEKGYQYKVISGGNEYITYCSYGLCCLQKKITERERLYNLAFTATPSVMQPISRDNFELGGCIAPWEDESKKSGWLIDETNYPCCALSDITSADDFKEPIKLLLGHYRYNMIYAAGAADYNPYDPTKSAAIHQMLERAVA